MKNEQISKITTEAINIEKLSELTPKGHRLSENPQELKCLEVFRKNVGQYSNNSMDYLVFGQKDNNSPNDFLSEREKQIVYSTIQWLGTHVGECYLRDCGYELKKEKL